jgi:hypothetical protein
MAKYKIERLAGDAADGLAPQLPDFMRRKAHKIMVIGELGRVKFEEDESGGGDRTVTLRWLQVQPVVGEAASRLRSVGRALWAAQNPQGELFGDFTVDLSPRTLRHMADEIGVQYYARLRFGVEEYVRQMGKLLEDDAASRSPQRWHEEVQFLHTALTAVLAAAEEPGQPSDLGPDVQPQLPLDASEAEEVDRSPYCNAPLGIPVGDGGDGYVVPCDLPPDADSHPLLNGEVEVEHRGTIFLDGDRVHAGFAGDGGVYAWPFAWGEAEAWPEGMAQRAEDGEPPTVPEGWGSVEGGGEVAGEAGGGKADGQARGDADEPRAATQDEVEAEADDLTHEDGDGDG